MAGGGGVDQGPSPGSRGGGEGRIGPSTPAPTQVSYKQDDLNS